ncbi:MAG: galactokinase [Steroidobacteraceae bacterium]
MLDAGQFAAAFTARFGQQPRLFRAPARVNIIGEHTDYNGGFVLPVATAPRTWVAIAPCAGSALTIYSVNFADTAQFAIKAPPAPGATDWSAYAAAVLRVLLEAGVPVKGANVLIQGDIPLGGGLSSSASFEVALALALTATAGAELDRRQIALLCQRAESEYVGVRCGIMDQYAIACSAAGSAMLLDCQSISHHAVPLPESLRLVVIASGVRHSLAQSSYNQRRAECAAALGKLRRRWPQLQTLCDLELGVAESAAAELGAVLWRRVRHVVTENRRVLEAERALRAGDARALGALLSASHHSLRDDFEVSCHELDVMVEAAGATAGVLGARMVGAGFGGCMLAVLEVVSFSPNLARLLECMSGILGHQPWHQVVVPCGAAAEIPASTRTRAGVNAS